MTRIENILLFAPRAEQFLADAVAATGLSDFGDEAFPFREGYELFLAELDREGRLSTEGAGATETQIGLMLRARLATVAAWKANPGYRDVEIRRPIIITGIVRSGTTALHHLMAIDSQFLGVPHWMVRAPRPLPPVETWTEAPDYQSAKAALERMIALAPEMLNDHMMSADAVEESIFLLAPTFANNMYPTQWTIPRYDAWYRSIDERHCYRWLADTLKLIGLGQGDRTWLMKNPTDLHAIAAVLDVFPDVKIIHTHRDPVQAIPSITNLLLSVKRMFEGANVEPKDILVREAKFWAEGLARTEAVKVRDPNRFFDIRFDDFVADQMGTVERIYAQFGLELDGAVADRMRAWLIANPRRPGTMQRHRAEDFAVDSGFLEETYRNYRSAYGYG